MTLASLDEVARSATAGIPVSIWLAVAAGCLLHADYFVYNEQCEHTMTQFDRFASYPSNSVCHLYVESSSHSLLGS